jgi:4-carboxymuconolactone decarboxylase
MTEEQLRVARELVSPPRSSLEGPFPWLLRSPEITDRLQRVGRYVRFESPVPAKLRELAILITARFWSAQYEWHAHRPLALAEGLDESVVAAIEQRLQPGFTDEAEAAVYALCTEILVSHEISDETYQSVLDCLGDEQLIDLIGLIGYYSLLAMVMATFQIPVPGGVPPLKH